MSDEIRNDDNMDELEKKFEEMMGKGKLGKCPNMTHLPNEEKEKIANQVLAHCAETLMSTYLSLGISGEAMVGLKDAISGRRCTLHFKTTEED